MAILPSRMGRKILLTINPIKGYHLITTATASTSSATWDLRRLPRILFILRYPQPSVQRFVCGLKNWLSKNPWDPCGCIPLKLAMLDTSAPRFQSSTARPIFSISIAFEVLRRDWTAISSSHFSLSLMGKQEQRRAGSFRHLRETCGLQLNLSIEGSNNGTSAKSLASGIWQDYSKLVGHYNAWKGGAPIGKDQTTWSS